MYIVLKVGNRITSDSEFYKKLYKRRDFGMLFHFYL
jgi:hypothetical protein